MRYNFGKLNREKFCLLYFECLDIKSSIFSNLFETRYKGMTINVFVMRHTIQHNIKLIIDIKVNKT